LGEVKMVLMNGSGLKKISVSLIVEGYTYLNGDV